jgi:tetratricopeptide (TPR) repeat protein
MGLFDWLRNKAGRSSSARVEALLNELFRSVAALADQGRWAEALPLAQRATDLARSHLGETHHDYAASLNNMAAVHRAMGDYHAALTLHRQAAEIRRAALGEAHPTTPPA